MDWLCELNTKMKGAGTSVYCSFLSDCEGYATGSFKYPDFLAMMDCPPNCESKDIFSSFSILSVLKIIITNK